ncbi:hypothetical protein [Deinococcus pimensis]|uniref:hypothetical protein n=1 Tax=Deinococcus pimensis TaxID=309888 RepID=UPI0004802537|nr:hypothetical protein [Deinococcus pimensis]
MNNDPHFKDDRTQLGAAALTATLARLYELLLALPLPDTVREGERGSDRDAVLFLFVPLFHHATRLWAAPESSAWHAGDVTLLLHHGRAALPFLHVEYGTWLSTHPQAPTEEARARFLQGRLEAPFPEDDQ